MTGTGNSGKPRPAGLGGWLWPVTLAAAVFPVLLTTSFVASVLSFIEFLRQEWNSPQPELAWAYRAISLHLLLALFSWWWALRWFARDPRMPRHAPLALSILGVLCTVLAMTDHHHMGYSTLAASFLGIAIASFLCVRWSKRIGNTFIADRLSAHATGQDAMPFDGPRDWSHGRWLPPGALLHAAFGLIPEWQVFADVASRAIPPPHPADPANDGCGFRLAVIGSGYSMAQIEAHREALAISLAAGLLVLGALVGLARGARWTAGITILAFAFAMAAPLRITLGEWCSPYVDGLNFRRMWWEWCVALILVTITTGFRYWPVPTMRA